jgi:hypothetical protein
MHSADAPQDFEAFYLHFLTSHTRSATRWMHVAGVGAGIIGVATAVATRRPLPAILGVAAAVGLAGGAHPLFEGNVPENTDAPPFWAARAVLRMCFRQVTGAIDVDLAAANQSTS